MKLTLPNQLDQLIQVKPNNEIYHIQLAIAKKKKTEKWRAVNQNILSKKMHKKEGKFEEQDDKLAQSHVYLL